MTAVELQPPRGGLSPGPQVWPTTVQAYHALGDLGLIPEKTELLYGQIFQKMPKSPQYRLLIMRLLHMLMKTLPPGLHVQPEQPILCGDSEPEPDISIIRGTINDYATEHPHTAELVVEICVSTHAYDRSKLRAYARAGVKECWLVLAPEQQIEVHRQPLGDAYQQKLVHSEKALPLVSTAVPSVALDLNTFFAG